MAVVTSAVEAAVEVAEEEAEDDEEDEEESQPPPPMWDVQPVSAAIPERSPGHHRVVSNGGCSDTSDFVYEDPKAEVRTSGRDSGREKRDMRLIYMVTAIQRPEELRKWIANASDVDALGMVHAVRQLQDAWMKSEADLINTQ
eukprot:2435593-Prymnesium_polylepis.1